MNPVAAPTTMKVVGKPTCVALAALWSLWIPVRHCAKAACTATTKILNTIGGTISPLIIGMMGIMIVFPMILGHKVQSYLSELKIRSSSFETLFEAVPIKTWFLFPLFGVVMHIHIETGLVLHTDLAHSLLRLDLAGLHKCLTDLTSQYGRGVVSVLNIYHVDKLEISGEITLLYDHEGTKNIQSHRKLSIFFKENEERCTVVYLGQQKTLSCRS